MPLAHVRRARPGSLRAAPCQTSSRSQLIGVCPSGTSCCGRPGRALRSAKRELVGELDRALDGAGVAGEPRGHLGAAAQVRAAGCRQPAVHLVEAAPGPHRGERRRRAGARAGSRSARCSVATIGSRRSRGEGGERVVVRLVERVAVVDELDDARCRAPNRRDEPVELAAAAASAPALAGERLPHRALAASGQHASTAPPARSASSSRS